MTNEEENLIEMASDLAYFAANFEFRVVDDDAGKDQSLVEYKKQLKVFAAAIIKYRKRLNLNYEMCGTMMSELAWIGFHAREHPRKRRKFIKACRDDTDDFI